MTLRLLLSSYDQKLLAGATQALTSPLVAPSFERWMADVNRSFRELLGADKAAFMFPPEGGEVRVCGDEFASTVLESYVREHLPELEERWHFRRRSLALGVFNRRLVYGEHLPEIYRSAYYNEYIVPNRAFDSVGMATALESPSKIVNLYFHHERPTGRRFGRRALDLLRMLYPAFASGVHAARSLFPMRQRLIALADIVPVAMALADAGGRILHRNRQLSSFRDADPEWSRVDAAIERAARLRAYASSACTIAARYTINCCTFGSGDDSAGAPAFVLLVTRSGGITFPAAALARRYGLTRRETDVARLLSEGSTNEAIARTLSISAATARHHTERVMRKLGVHSRAQIPTVVATFDPGD